MANAIARDGNTIHSVAKEFEAIDQKTKFDSGDFSLRGKI